MQLVVNKNKIKLKTKWNFDSLCKLFVLQLCSSVKWKMRKAEEILSNLLGRDNKNSWNYNFSSFSPLGKIIFTLWNLSIFQREYFAKHPGGVNPVQPNDVFFTLHAILLTTITIFQCFCYEVSILNTFSLYFILSWEYGCSCKLKFTTTTVRLWLQRNIFSNKTDWRYRIF